MLGVGIYILCVCIYYGVGIYIRNGGPQMLCKYIFVPLHKVGGTSAERSSKLDALHSVCTTFAEHGGWRTFCLLLRPRSCLVVVYYY